VFACAGKADPPSLLIPLADLGWKRLLDQAEPDSAVARACAETLGREKAADLRG
jgi:hypothetical protein